MSEKPSSRFTTKGQNWLLSASNFQEYITCNPLEHSEKCTSTVYSFFQMGCFRLWPHFNCQLPKWSLCLYQLSQCIPSSSLLFLPLSSTLSLSFTHHENLDPQRNFQELLIMILAHTMTSECLIVHATYTFWILSSCLFLFSFLSCAVLFQGA